MRLVKRLPKPIREIENVWIPMKDGTRLAARIWLPEDAESNPVPAILEAIPYRKRDGTAVGDSYTHPFFAGHGYAAVRLDLRGSGDSDGVLKDEYLKGEQDDIVEVLAWIGRQPWCTGKAGMIGISWGGFAGLQVAARRPPELAAIVTVCSTDDRYADDVHYMGGCLLNDGVSWGSGLFGVSKRCPDPLLGGNRWREMWLDRLENSGLALLNWLRHERRDDYWRHGSVCEDYAAIQCPVFAVGGWTDGYTNAILRLMEGLSVPKRALIGPWTHVYPHFGFPGPEVGFLQECLRWWDRWLKGVENGIESEPALRIFMQEAMRADPNGPTLDGRWIAERTWPPRRTTEKRLVLNADGLETRARRSQTLKIRSPETCGMAAGEWCPRDGGGEGPEFQGDQRPDDALSLCFDTAPLTRRVSILGYTALELEIAVDRPVALVCARLCDVAPDGLSTRVTFGLFNLCHRDGHAAPELMEPETPTRVRLVLKSTAYTFRPGHRIRLALSTNYWPMAWPAPQPVTLSVTSGASTMVLPVWAPSGERLPALKPAEGSSPLVASVTRKGAITRRVEYDLGAKRTVYEHVEDSGARLLDGIGMQTDRVGRDTYTIVENDPTSAEAEMHRVVTSRRGEWHATTESRLILTCDRDRFRLRAWIDATDGGRKIFQRSWDEFMPRDHL